MLNKSLKIFLCRPEWLICLALAVVTLFVFWQVRNSEFINYDDGKYIYENPHIQDGITWEGIQWALTADLLFDSPHADFWIPVTFLSHIFSSELFGMDASGHHLINLLFHVLNSVMLFCVLTRMTGTLWQSAFVAALFAVHPLHVESVAWVTERKDVLSTFFWMLTMWSYHRYTQNSSLHRYLLVFLALALGLMTKPMLITLPFVFLLLDFWPLGRLRLGHDRALWKLVWEKIPLFALSITSIIITYLALHQGGHIRSFEIYPLWTRIGNALVAYATYIGKMAWPQGLAVLYPHPGNTLPAWQMIGAGLFLMGISILVFRWTPRRPYLGVGWLWYLGTLFPVIGLLQAGLQSMADRYTYVPIIGLFIIIAWGISDLAIKWNIPRKVLNVSAVILLLILMVGTWLQVNHWRNSITLFEHTTAVTSNNYLAHHNLGSAYHKKERLGDAIREYKRGLAIKPDYFYSRMALGSAYETQGHLNEAIREYQKALILRPKNFIPYFALGSVFHKKGRLNDAIREYQRAVNIKPNFALAHHKLGTAYQEQGNLDEAIREYQRALSLSPGSEGIHNNLGVIYGRKGQWDIAIQEFNFALKLSPQFLEAGQNLKKALKKKEMGK